MSYLHRNRLAVRILPSIRKRYRACSFSSGRGFLPLSTTRPSASTRVPLRDGMLSGGTRARRIGEGEGTLIEKIVCSSRFSWDSLVK